MTHDIETGLEHHAQTNRERMPEEMAKNDTERVVLALRNFMAEFGYSQAKIARQAGVHSSAISNFLSGRYGAKTDRLAAKIIDIINNLSRRERQTRSRPTFVKTTIATAINTLISSTASFSTEDEGKIGVLIGDSGHGKSICLQQYAKAHTNAVYVQLDDAMSKTAIFAEIAKALTDRKVAVDGSGALTRITQRLAEALHDLNMIVILDEASALTVPKLNLLRQIIVIKSRCPLILSGNRYLWQTILQPVTRRGCENLDQFRSRLMQPLDLDLTAGQGDGGGLYTDEDIIKMYKYGGLNLKRDAVDALRHICCTPSSGRMRTCSQLIALLHTSPEAEKAGYIDAAALRDAIAFAGFPVRLPVAPIATQDEAVDLAAAAG